MGRRKFDPDAYVEWLTRVPEESRLQLAEMFSENEINDYDGLVRFSQQVMIQVLAGNIPPVAAEAASHWAEIMLTSLAAKKSDTLSTSGDYADLVTMLTSIEDDAVEASYTTVEAEYDEAVNG
jgi:hypothetical protein